MMYQVIGNHLGKDLPILSIYAMGDGKQTNALWSKQKDLGSMECNDAFAKSHSCGHTDLCVKNRSCCPHAKRLDASTEITFVINLSRTKKFPKKDKK